jgi:hypothetical protein
MPMPTDKMIAAAMPTPDQIQIGRDVRASG